MKKEVMLFTSKTYLSVVVSKADPIITANGSSLWIHQRGYYDGFRVTPVGILTEDEV